MNNNLEIKNSCSKNFSGTKISKSFFFFKEKGGYRRKNWIDLNEKNTRVLNKV